MLEEANEEFLVLSWKSAEDEDTRRHQEKMMTSEEDNDIKRHQERKTTSGEDDDAIFFSLLFSPCGYVVFELVSNRLDPGAIDVVQHPNPRFYPQRLPLIGFVILLMSG